MTEAGSRKLRTLVTAPLLHERDAVRGIYGHVRGRRPLPPSPVSGGRRLTYGFLLPFHLFARLVTVPELRRTAGRLFLARALFVVLFTAVGMLAIGFNEDRPDASSDIVVDHGGIHIRGSETDLKKAVKSLRDENAREAAEGDRIEAAVGAAVADVVEREGAASPVIAPTISWKKRLATLLAFLGAAEWIAIAFTRDFDDVVSHELSLDAGILPEGERPSPRLRFSPSWLWKKYKRKFRGILLFGIGALPLALAIAFGSFGWLSNTLFALWGFYWSAVFVAAKNAHAWADDGRASPPWFLRPFDPMPKQFVFAPVRAYLRLAHRVTKSVHGPCQAFERSPLPFIGLALFRLLLAPPFLYLLFRPIMPVAAGRILADNNAEARFFPRETATTPAALTEPLPAEFEEERLDGELGGGVSVEFASRTKNA
jgi:hypothetical protein